MDENTDFHPDRAPTSLEEVREPECFPSWADAPTATDFHHPGESDSSVETSPLGDDAEVSNTSFLAGGADDEPHAEVPPPPPKRTRASRNTPNTERAAKKQRGAADTGRRQRVPPPSAVG